MAKKLTNNGGSQAAATIGLDIGYGVTKAITDTQAVVFPSVWGAARELKFQQADIAAKYPGDQLSDDDGDWYVGDLALSQLRAGEQIKLRGRTADESALGNVARARLAKVAIGKLFKGRHGGDVVHIRIATGLPVDHMRGAADLKAALVGQHHIKTDQTDIVANITEVMVMPQPYGTVYSRMLTAAGQLDPCHTATRTGVCDVGTYTIDVTLDDDGEYIDARSGSVEAGVYLIQEVITDAYDSRYGQKPDYRTVETIIKTGCVRISGEVVSFTDALNAGIDKLNAATLSLLNDRWQAGRDIDVIYISGGGARFVERAVKSAYPQAVVVDESQLANARGYLSYAHFAASN